LLNALSGLSCCMIKEVSQVPFEAGLLEPFAIHDQQERVLRRPKPGSRRNGLPLMKRYGGADKNSGVTHYAYGDDWFHAVFKDNYVYEYLASGIGRHRLETMKRLADAGDGLTTYINRNREVRDGYSMKWPWR
jgi:hypothetical protein